MLGEGDKMPAVRVKDDTGKDIDTKSLTGKPLVLYFYPKDDTPGCTSEASQFRDDYDKFEAKGAEIIGVSKDSVASHQRFKKKYGIPFPLLADVDGKLCNAFGVISDKTLYGKLVKGITRATFLFDKDGTIVKVWPKVKVDGHAEDVYNALNT